jgi:predicted HNH restriction endonuclease
MRERFGYKPGTTVTRGTIDKIVKQRKEVTRLIEELQASLSLLPGELARPSLYIEGAIRRVSVNAYERSQEAALQCKAVRGTTCVVCGFDFGAVYGTEFAGFIHVHHLRPLSEIGAEYVVNPVTDLCPVCPNCHAVIHYGGRLRSVEEVRGLLEQQRHS